MADSSDFRDTLYTIDKSGTRKWVYARYLPGRFFKYRKVIAYLLMLFYLSMPWIIINGKQGILLDISHRRFIFFGLELWATDTIFLYIFLGLAGMFLFFFTSIFGRVWCGWACPETVFLEFLFRPIERLIEGPDHIRKQLDQAPWTFNKIIKKLIKHAFCAASAWVIASTALAYFFGREPLLNMMTQPPMNNPLPFFLTLAMMGLMAFQFGWFREQFCTIVCPYARFQSVLMDESSIFVGYDSIRGEPRGKLKDKTDQSGDCVDCGLCVQVCPTGIDIRNGSQLECIACTACIDACDYTMAKINKPLGLIRYDTEAGLKHKTSSWFRPRILIYSAIILTLTSLLIYKLSSRRFVDLEIIRDIHAAPFSLNETNVSNQFSIRVSNKGSNKVNFKISVITPGVQAVSPIEQISIKPEESQIVPVFFMTDLKNFSKGTLPINVRVAISNGEEINRNLTLLGPDK